MGCSNHFDEPSKTNPGNSNVHVQQCQHRIALSCFFSPVCQLWLAMHCIRHSSLELDSQANVFCLRGKTKLGVLSWEVECHHHVTVGTKAAAGAATVVTAAAATVLMFQCLNMSLMWRPEFFNSINLKLHWPG